jgi:hypothetical protein
MAITLAPTHLPHVQVATTGSSGIVTQVNLPTTRHLQLNIHNRDNASKGAMVSFDQTLTDGGPAPATGAWTIDQYLAYNVNGNGANGMASVTKFFVFSPSHNAVTIEFLLTTSKPAN